MSIIIETGIYETTGAHSLILYEFLDSEVIDFAKTILKSNIIMNVIIVNKVHYTIISDLHANEQSHKRNEKFPQLYGEVLVIPTYSNIIIQYADIQMNFKK